MIKLLLLLWDKRRRKMALQIWKVMKAGMIGFGVSANSPSSSLLRKNFQKSFRIQTISFFATFLCSQLSILDSCSWSSLNLEVVPVLESLIRNLVQVVKVPGHHNHKMSIWFRCMNYTQINIYSKYWHRIWW